jgi:hypothetical protein
MRALSCLSALLALSLAGRAAAVDLTQIDRSLRKEPVYRSRAPQYCLLAFGPQAKTRVWVVLDGDDLYLDRNGNGDLTDPGERVAPKYAHHRPEFRPEAEFLRNFSLNRLKKSPQKSDGPILSCGPEVLWFEVFQLVPREDYPDPEEVKFWQKTPFHVSLLLGTGLGQQSAYVRFADRPQEAPILYFDGPMQLKVDDKFGPLAFRRGETSELYVQLVTPGLNATLTTMHSDTTGDAHPVVEIEFPPGRTDGDPIRQRVELKGRC